MFENRVSTFGFVALAIALGPLSATAKPVVFDFEDQAFGAATPLSITSDGVTATFTSPADAGGFQISGGLYNTLTGNYLASGADFATGNALAIAFSIPVRSITLDFAADTSPTLTLATDGNGSASASGTIPGGFYFYPEGVLSFAGDRFTRP